MMRAWGHWEDTQRGREREREIGNRITGGPYTDVERTPSHGEITEPQAMWPWIECSWTPKSNVLGIFHSCRESTQTWREHRDVKNTAEVRTHYLGDNTSVTQLLSLGLVLSSLWKISHFSLLHGFFSILSSFLQLWLAHGPPCSLYLFSIHDLSASYLADNCLSCCLFPERESNWPSPYFYSTPLKWLLVSELAIDGSGAHHLFPLHKEQRSSGSQNKDYEQGSFSRRGRWICSHHDMPSK